MTYLLDGKPLSDIPRGQLEAELIFALERCATYERMLGNVSTGFVRSKIDEAARERIREANGISPPAIAERPTDLGEGT